MSQAANSTKRTHTTAPKAATFNPSAWRNGSEGFFAFLRDVQPRVRNDRGQFVPYMPTGQIRDEIAKAIDGDYSVAVFCWSRRHGKTLAAVMIALWRFITRTGENMAIVANSELQVISTAFKTLLDAFRQTPMLKALADRGEIKVGADRIEAPELSNTIQAFTANAGALWGKKLTLAQISELHAATSGAVLDALQGSLLDSTGSLLLVDSTVGPKSSPLYGLYNASQDSTSGILFSHIQYRDLDDALVNSPPWIDRTKLRNLARTMLPTQFALMHLNRWGDASGSLFSAEVIERCTREYPLNVRAICGAAAHVVGAGLDRAYGHTLRGDKTVTTCVLKTVEDDEDHYYVLASESVLFSRLATIRSNLAEYARKFGMTRAAIEQPNAQDVHDWLTTQTYGSNAELVFPTRTRQAQAFTTLFAAANESRLHIDPSFTSLLAEMASIEIISATHGKNSEHDDNGASVPKFKGAKGTHDDFVFSLCWAVYSLRDTHLNAYSLDGVVCNGSAAVVPLCALNGGQMVPSCADTCRSMRAAIQMHRDHTTRKPTSAIPLDEFIATRIKNTGAYSLPR